MHGKLLDILDKRELSVTIDNILDNSKAASGGERDINFLKYLISAKLLVPSEVVLKRTNLDFNEEYYIQKYKKASFESDRHFLCRTIIQDELEKKGINCFDNTNMGNMEILRSNSNYDIVTADLTAVIDVGLTPARNYFRGLTDLKVKNYLLTTYFDDYIDDIIFSVFSRSNDDEFINAVKDYMEGYKLYVPDKQNQDMAELDNSGSVM